MDTLLSNWKSLFWVLIAFSIMVPLLDAAPYGGWGPKQGFGHTGSNPPPENINAIYGYDYHDVFDDWTTYGSVYNPHKTRKNLFSKHEKKAIITHPNPIDYMGSFSDSHPNAKVYMKSNRHPKPFEEFYLKLESMFHQYNVPRLEY